MAKKKILVAEDDLLLLKSLGYYLDKQGYEVFPVSDGREAIEKIKQLDFDLIVTDLNMPFSNGMEIISLVRNELKKRTPIIVLTAMGLEATELDAFRIGADEFISKPFSPHVLGVRIEKLISGNAK
jgi:DNA-binding response OmpR family regulator